MSGDIEFRAIASDGLVIRGVTRQVAHVRACVVMCHGIGSTRAHVGLFDRFADEAERYGISAIRFDFRAHGESDGAALDLTLHGAALDLEAVVMDQVDANLPLSLLGVSFGCGPAVRFCSGAAPRQVRGLVLWNPVVNFARTFLRSNNRWSAAIVESRKAALPNGVAALLPNVRRPAISERLETEFKTDRTSETLAALRQPVVLFHGTEDAKVPFAFSKSVALGAPAVEFVALAGADHSFAGHQALLIERTIEWISQRSSA